MELSYWEKNTFFENIDIAIIGSGIVGLSAAIHLKKLAPQLNILILERGVIPSGASTRNAGFACFGSVSELAADLENIGLDALLTLVEMRWKGLERLKKRVGEEALGFKQLGGYELFLNQKTFEPCADKIAFFNQHLQPIIGMSEVFKTAKNKILTFGFRGVEELIFNQAEGQINTGKMMAALLGIAQREGIRIFNGITIKNMHRENSGTTLETDDGWCIKTRKTLVAVNGFAQKILPELEVQPARNQVLITKPIPNLRIKGTFHYDSGFYYFRNIDNRILLGGGRNLSPKTETTAEFGTTELIQNQLIKMLNTIILPSQTTEVDRWWSGILGVGETKTPIVKMLNEHMGVAVKMGGMGIAIGSLIGEQAAVMLLDNY